MMCLGQSLNKLLCNLKTDVRCTHVLPASVINLEVCDDGYVVVNRRAAHAVRLALLVCVGLLPK